MSEFHIIATTIKNIVEHPNADRLEIAYVYDYPVIVKKDEFKTSELVVYLPLEAVVPDTLEWHYLSPKDSSSMSRYEVGQVPMKYRTIEAKKIRGIFSQGMIVKLPSGEWKEGDDLQEIMNITRAPEPEEVVKTTTGGDCESPPKGYVIPVYTDIEGMKRYPNVLIEGEEVVLSEKLHGTNFRAVHDGTRLWVASHKQIKRDDPTSLWWNVAHKLELAEKLARAPMHVFYGEVYGQVQDLKYGIKQGAEFRVFDIFSINEGRYLDHDDAQQLATSLSLDWVPILYRGPWHDGLKQLCEGNTTIPGADCIREGFVVKPVKERYDHSVGRVILKLVGETYLLRKKK